MITYQKLHLLFALILMLNSVWMYKSSVNPSILHLSPLLVGIILLSLNNGIRDGVKEQKKVSFYLAVSCAMVATVLLFVPNVWIEEGFVYNLITMMVMALMLVISFIFDRHKKVKAR